MTSKSVPDSGPFIDEFAALEDGERHDKETAFGHADGLSPVKSRLRNPLRTLVRLLGGGLIGLLVVAVAAWGALALWFAVPAVDGLRAALALGFVALGVGGLLAAVLRQRLGS